MYKYLNKQPEMGMQIIYPMKIYIKTFNQKLTIKTIENVKDVKNFRKEKKLLKIPKLKSNMMQALKKISGLWK